MDTKNIRFDNLKVYKFYKINGNMAVIFTVQGILFKGGVKDLNNRWSYTTKYYTTSAEVLEVLIDIVKDKVLSETN